MRQKTPAEKAAEKMYEAVEKLRQVGVEEEAIRRLLQQNPLGLSEDAKHREAVWRDHDAQAKRSAALKALRDALKVPPRDGIPVDLLAWIKGEAPSPCWIPPAERGSLRAVVSNAKTETTLFDPVGK